MKKVELRTMEQIKYEIIKKLVDNNGNKQRADIKLGISLRQVNRLIKIYKTQGKSGFVHGNRGRLPKKTISQEVKDKILNLYKTKYYNANFKHFLELLQEYTNINISYTALCTIFRKANILSPKVQKDTVKLEKKKKYTCHISPITHHWKQASYLAYLYNNKRTKEYAYV